MKKFKFGSLTAIVRPDGTGRPPWGASHAVHQYKVTVSGGGVRYGTQAWGSVNDTYANRRDEASIAAMVVDELLSAAADPDEFVQMVMGDARGREALRRGKAAEKTVKKARAFGYEDLSAAVEAAREKGLL